MTATVVQELLLGKLFDNFHSYLVDQCCRVACQAALSQRRCRTMTTAVAEPGTRLAEEADVDRVISVVVRMLLARDRIGIDELAIRSGVSRFMNKFRTLVFIAYNGAIHIRHSLRDIVLQDNPHLRSRQ